jgi:hypothetical protein
MAEDEEIEEEAVPIAAGQEVGYLSKWEPTLGACDVQGQTATALRDWYRPQEFVCMHCLQPARGIPFGLPMGTEKVADNGKTVWIVRGRFGSVACARRYADDTRYTFSQENCGQLGVMLLRVYGFKGDLAEVPVAPARTDLPPFQPKLCAKWRAGQIQFNGYDMHEHYNAPLKLHAPNPDHHTILPDHLFLLVDAVVPRQHLPPHIRKAAELRRTLPSLHILPAAANSRR